MPVAVLSYNTTYHSTIGCTPFEMMFGKRFAFPSDTISQRQTPQDLHAKIMQSEIEECRANAIALQSDAQQQSRKYFEINHRLREFKVGELVLVRKNKRSTNKLENRYFGPFVVTKKDNDIYELVNPENDKTLRRHTSCLKPFVQATDAQTQSESTSNAADAPFAPTTNNDNSDRNRLQISDHSYALPTQELSSQNIQPSIVGSIRSITTKPENKSQQAIDNITESINKMRRGSERTSGMMAKWKVLMILMLITSTDAKATIKFERTTPVIWEPMRIKVVEGMNHYNINIHFTSPCNKLKEISEFTPNATIEAFNLCEKLFRDDILAPIETVNHEDFLDNSRDRRFLIGFIVGYFISDTIRTVIDNALHPSLDHDVEKIKREQEEKMKQISNLSQLRSEAVTKSLEMLTTNLHQTNNNLAYLAHADPQIAILSGYIMSRISMKSHLIFALLSEARSGTLDIVTLAELLENNMLDNIDQRTVNLKKMSSPSTGWLSVQFLARKVDKTTRLYKVHTFKHQTGRFEEEPKWTKYAGSEFLVHNTSSNCIKGIQELDNSFVATMCDTKDQVDLSVSKWIDLDRKPEPQMYASWPYTFVYCYDFWIKIEGETYRCPPFPFKLNATLSFNTTNINYAGIEEITSTSVAIYHDALDKVHFANDLTELDENLAIDKIRELGRKIKLLNEEQIALKVSEDKTLSYRTTTNIFSSTTGICIIVLVLIFAFKRSNRKSQPNINIDNSQPNLHPNARKYLASIS